MRITITIFILLLSLTSFSQQIERKEAYHFFKERLGEKFSIRVELNKLNGCTRYQKWRWRIDNLGVEVIDGDSLLCAVNLTCLSSRLKNHHVITMVANDELHLGLLDLMCDPNNPKTIEEIYRDMDFRLIQSVKKY